MLAGHAPDRVPKSGTSVAYTTTRAPGELFIQLSVRAGRDTRLKLAAKGLLFELLTYHDAELPSDEDLYEAHRSAREAEGLKPDGIDLIRGALADLERAGYLVRLTIRDAGGQRRSVRALTDSPGHHKLDIIKIHEAADAVAKKDERLAQQRALLVQQEFPRGAHCPPPGSLGVAQDRKVVSLAAHRAARTEREAV
jgi:hypothetical protein